MLMDIIKQADVSERLLARAESAVKRVRGLRSGDSVYTPIIGAAEFMQGQAPSANIVFNVPADADFWGYRFRLYPFCKVIDPEYGTPDEIVYRPTSFFSQPMEPGIASPATRWVDFNTLVDGTFGFTDGGRDIQNVDVPFAAAYCVDIDKWTNYDVNNTSPTWAAASQTPGGLVFDVPMFIPRGRSVVCRITPTYLGIRTITETVSISDVPTTVTRQHKYKIVAVLEGEKKVAAFR